MAADAASAFWIAAPGEGKSGPSRSTPPSADDVVVRALYSGISRGTEALVFQGRVPPSEFQRMRAPFQDGSFPAPISTATPASAVIERGPRELQDRTVFVLYPHQTRYVVPAQSVHVLPDDVPPERAVLTANLETAINGLWDARPHIGDRIVVVGAGTVGCLVAWLAGRIPGCDVELVDINPRREAIAHVFGVRFAPPDTVVGRRRRRHSRERFARRTRARAESRRVRGDHRRDELVRRSAGGAAARRGVPCATADAEVASDLMQACGIKQVECAGHIVPIIK